MIKVSSSVSVCCGHGENRVTLVMKISVDNEMGPSWGKGHVVLYCDGIEPFLGLLWDTS